MVSLNRTERLAAITLLLLARRRVTASEIARTFEISERTVYRDIQGLAEGGLPVVALPGSGGGYELPPDYRLMPLTLTFDEGVALWTALQAFAAADHPLREAARGAWLRIHTALPEELRRHIVDLGSTVDVTRMLPDGRVGPASPPHAVFATLVRALRERRQVRIVYHVPATGETTERTIHVYGLACVRGRWYAPALCQLREGLRSFRLDRIREATLLDATYVLPRDFDLAAWVRGMFAYEDQGAERIPVRIRFSAQGARRAVDDRSFRESLRRLDEGSFEATLDIPAADLPWYATLVVGYAGEAEVVSPPELRREVERLAARIAASHA